MTRLLFLFAVLLHLVPAQAAPSCIPGIYGTQVGNAGYERTDAGWFAYWFCRKVDGGVTAHTLACVHGSCLPIGTFADRVTTMKRGTNPVQTIQSAWDAEVGNKCVDATGSLKTVCDQAAAASKANAPQIEAPPPPPPPPPAYTHAVKANGTSTTRPVYLLTNGVRGTTSVGRADVGQPCDLTKPTLANGSDVWASFGPLFEPGKVALCSKNASGAPAAGQ